MEQAYQLIEQINWFLKPVSELIQYLFTTKEGLWILAILFLLYFFISLGNLFWHRKMLHLSARSSYERGRVPGAEKIAIIFSHITKVIFNIVMKFPVLLAALLLVFFISGVTDSVTQMHNYVENQKKINKLETTLKNLNQSYKVAEMEVTDVDYSDMTDIKSTLEFAFYDYADMGFVSDTQRITMSGRDIYIDAIVMNFKYTQISSGEDINLAIPYRVYSNKVSQIEGTKLRLKDENGVPFIFHRPEDKVYGINNKKFSDNLSTIAGYVKNPDTARQAGIRSTYGNAVHTRVRAGQKYEIQVEQTGGLTLNRIQ